jgi:phage shock protein A
MDKDLIIESLTKQVADLTALVQTLTKSNADLTETIKELQETIKELQRQLNQNSQNSSKPPSSDGFNKPNPQSQRQKSGK